MRETSQKCEHDAHHLNIRGLFQLVQLVENVSHHGALLTLETMRIMFSFVDYSCSTAVVNLFFRLSLSISLPPSFTFFSGVRYQRSIMVACRETQFYNGWLQCSCRTSTQSLCSPIVFDLCIRTFPHCG